MTQMPNSSLKSFLLENNHNLQQEEVSCTHCGSTNNKYSCPYIYYMRNQVKDEAKCYYFCKDCQIRFVGFKSGQLHCKRCQGQNFVRHSTAIEENRVKVKGKSRYICQDCGRSFIGSEFKGKTYRVDPEKEYLKDIWDVRCLGLEAPPASSRYKLNFTHISQAWLRQAAKQFVRYILTTNSVSEACNKLTSLKRFSRFLSERSPTITSSDINRSVVVEWLSYLSQRSYNVKIKSIIHLRQFLEICQRNNWLELTDKPLIYREDYPGKQPKPTPRAIPNEVLEQLNKSLDSLPEPYMRMILVLQETGMRVAELCLLQFDCLRQDAHGDWFLNYYQFKMKKGHSIPISRELVAVIQEQQAFITEQFGGIFNYLFCSRIQHKWIIKPMGTRGFCDVLVRLAQEKNICDSSGRPWRFQSHQFRHTVGTSMINRGVPLHIIQKYLGHETPEMTMRYARIYDQTLKEEIAKFQGKVVNIAGQVIESSAPELDTADLQWFKRNIQAQALSNGSCALPAPMKECPHANACLTCTHFRTTIEFLDQHKEQLYQTQKIIEKAKVNGWTRQVEMNERVMANLQHMIKSLEAGNGE